MTLELTPTEYNNLAAHLAVAEIIRTTNRTATTPEREAAILQMLHAHKSNMDIKRALRTSDVVINKIKKANGLWGV